MTFVSVTRARMRAFWFAPGFFLAAQGAIRQAQDAPGFRGGALLPDRKLTFWTLTVWESEAAMRGYMLSGAHVKAMPKFIDWCDEASVVHWEQAEDAVPGWPVAAERMRREGRPSRLRHPTADHLAMTYAEPRLGFGGPITPRR